MCKNNISMTTTDWEFVTHLPLTDPIVVLRALARYVEQYKLWSEESVHVAVHLVSGQLVHGKVLRISSDGQNECVLLMDYDSRQPLKEPALIYIRLQDVTALRIEQANNVQRILIACFSKSHNATPPSQLQLKRIVQTLQQKLVQQGLNLTLEFDWNSIKGQPEELTILAAFLQVLEATFNSLLTEEMGAAAVKQLVAINIRSVSGKNMACEKLESKLTIVHDLKYPLRETAAVDLKSNLESVF